MNLYSQLSAVLLVLLQPYAKYSDRNSYQLQVALSAYSFIGFSQLKPTANIFL